MPRRVAQRIALPALALTVAGVVVGEAWSFRSGFAATVGEEQ